MTLIAWTFLTACALLDVTRAEVTFSSSGVSFSPSPLADATFFPGFVSTSVPVIRFPGRNQDTVVQFVLADSQTSKSYAPSVAQFAPSPSRPSKPYAPSVSQFSPPPPPPPPPLPPPPPPPTPSQPPQPTPTQSPQSIYGLPPQSTPPPPQLLAPSPPSTMLPENSQLSTTPQFIPPLPPLSIPSQLAPAPPVNIPIPVSPISAASSRPGTTVTETDHSESGYGSHHSVATSLLPSRIDYQSDDGSQYSDTREINGYSYSYQSADGSTRSEIGEIRPSSNGNHVLVFRGSYSYLSPEGRTVRVQYIADEAGFRHFEV